MSKDPAFLFYPGDWLGGTLGMSLEEKGAYIEVLMLQFNRGHMTSHMVGQVVGQIWDKIQHKFVKDEKGLWYNERLEEEKNKRKSFTHSRKNNLKGNNQHTKKEENKIGHMTSHMESEDSIHTVINKDVEINLIDIWLTDLPNSSDIETIAMRNGLTKEYVLNQISLFKPKMDLTYPNKERFINHFKNFVVLSKNNPTKKLPKQLS